MLVLYRSIKQRGTLLLLALTILIVIIVVEVPATVVIPIIIVVTNVSICPYVLLINQDPTKLLKSFEAAPLKIILPSTPGRAICSLAVMPFIM